MHDLLLAAMILGGLGAVCGIGLAIAGQFLRVEEDPRLDILEQMLPGSNCGACGEAGCRAFAETLLAGVHKPSACSVSSAENVESIAAMLGVDAGKAIKRVARVHCAGGLSAARRIADYEGYESCRSGALVGGGGKACAWGCLGLADCAAACTFDAIVMNDQALPVVDIDRCTACGDCVAACPRDLIDILPITHKLIVQCRAPVEGAEARAICRVACDACGRCAQDAAPGLIRMVGNLPLVDYAAGGPASPDATGRCPTGAIQWIDGPQFTPARNATRAGVHLD